MEFVLTQDDDGHWYVCPADKQDDAATYFAAVDGYWRSPAEEGIDEPPQPEWLERVGGAPSRVKFTGYKID